MTNLHVEPASPCERGHTCGECEHFAVAPHWHERPWQGNADGVCDLDLTNDDIEWVREDDPACKDWER
jgi:hypothetical protein